MLAIILAVSSLAASPRNRSTWLQSCSFPYLTAIGLKYHLTAEFKNWPSRFSFVRCGVSVGEGRDRGSIGLPGMQPALVDLVLSANKPVVALIFSGGSVSVNALRSAKNAAGIGCPIFGHQRP